MSEDLLNNEIQKVELEKINKIKQSIANLKEKKSKFLFVIPDSTTPVASVYEIYFHATTVKKMGFDVTILVEKDDYVIPKWIENKLTDFNHISMSDSKLTVGPDSIMVIPEVYSNVMEQTKNLPCLRIGLLQSIDYMYNALIPGTDWSTFGIRDIITTSPVMKEIVEMLFGKKFNVKTYQIGIPDYFEKSNLPKKPIISIVGRNPNEISKLIKMFYNKYPHYNWVMFDTMLTKSKPPQQMRRIDFADRLKEHFAAVWIDRISSFGTFPLECIQSGVIPICLKPDIMPEYLINRDENGVAINAKNNSGIWTDNFYDLPIHIGEILTKFIDDSIPNEIYDNMDEIALKYNQETSEKTLISIYEEFVNQRILMLESAIPVENNNDNLK